MKKRFAVILFALLCLVSAQDMTENRIDLIRPDSPELTARGPYQIGVQTLELIHPDQLDIVNASGSTIPSYDRPLTLEVWYPASLSPDQKPGETYKVATRDGELVVDIHGLALRDASPNQSAAPYPLIIISHGYPGNRFLLSHFGENLASKGYVVVSIDHTDSTYSDLSTFASTLLNRSLDQLFVLEQMTKQSLKEDSFLKGIVNTDMTGIIGYSMGGYGAVNVAGGGYTEASVGYGFSPANGALAVRQTGNKAFEDSFDARVKAVIAIAPWGMNAGFWDAEGLKGVKVPIMFMAGDADDVAGYENGTKALYDLSINAERYLLTFENANHNAAAPMPAPFETWQASDKLDFIPAEHYNDPVWDNVRMNNIAQHFATAFFGKYLKDDANLASYLDIIERAEDGIWSTDSAGQITKGHTYWKGFPNRTGIGLSLMQAKPD